MKHALVTGATGFIGRHLCSILMNRGVTVTALMRQQSDGPWDRVVIADLEAGSLPPHLCNGVDTLFHIAGKAHALAETRQDEAEYFRINTEATQKLLECAKDAGIERFIYFSSVKAAGDIDGVMDESVDKEPDTPYGKSKRSSEQLLLSGNYVPHPVVIRPSMVYGNCDKGNLPKMIRAIRENKFPPLPETHNRRSMVHVDDVVAAAILAADCDAAAGKIYIVTDGEAYSTRQMYEWICHALNRPLPQWHMPISLLKSMAKVGDLIGAIRGRRFIFDSDALQKLTSSAWYSSAKIEQELGFSARRRLDEALPEIIGFLEMSS